MKASVINQPEAATAKGPRPVPETLWQHVLHWIDEHANTFHWKDQWRLVGQLQQMYWVGERPTLSEVRIYADALLAPPLRDEVCKRWKLVLRYPHRKFRVVESEGGWGLFALDLLVEEHGLRPLDDRLLESARGALARFHRVALSERDVEAWLAARRDVDRALETIEQLRRVRLGPPAVGDYPAGEGSIEAFDRYRKLKRKYGRA